MRSELLILGDRIRHARELLGFSPKKFASRCGLDSTYLRGIERGEHNITFSILCAICEGLACDIASVTIGIPRLLADSAPLQLLA
jgi:transcriptional regulator with XRE-family HTH domain